jgi:hypothetical protein
MNNLQLKKPIPTKKTTHLVQEPQWPLKCRTFKVSHKILHCLEIKSHEIENNQQPELNQVNNESLNQELQPETSS